MFLFTPLLLISIHAVSLVSYLETPAAYAVKLCLLLCCPLVFCRILQHPVWFFLNPPFLILQDEYIFGLVLVISIVSLSAHFFRVEFIGFPCTPQCINITTHHIAQSIPIHPLFSPSLHSVYTQIIFSSCWCSWILTKGFLHSKIQCPKEIQPWLASEPV